jgi:hypothetical protein
VSIVLIEIFHAGRWYRQALVRQLPLPHARETHVPLQDAQDPESELEIVMEDVGTDDTTGSGLDFGGPIREASSATDSEHFRKNLVYKFSCTRNSMNHFSV